MMRRVLSLLSFIVLSIPAFAAHKVIVISIDGLRGTTLADLPNRGLKTPNLVEFLHQGSYADGLIGVFPTVTYPSHTTLVTGVNPATHGILGNELFDPEKKTNAAWYWYSEAIKVPTLWDIAHQQHRTTAAVSWPVTVGASIDYNFPEHRALVTEEELMLYRAVCTPGLSAEFEKASGPMFVTEPNDELRTRQSVFLINTRKPDVMFIHLADTDHQEHLHGPDSPEFYRALETIDGMIGQLRAAVAKSEPNDDVDWFIVSDHGFFPVEQAFKPAAVLASIGLAAPEGHPDKWRVGVHPNAGSFGLVVHDPNDKEAIKLATDTFEMIQKQGAFGLAKVFTGADLAATKGYTNSFLAGTTGPGFSVSGTATGTWLASSGTTLGTHGFIPGDPRLDAAFLAVGKGIPAKRIGRHHSIDVAPTIANRMGWSMQHVEGENILK